MLLSSYPKTASDSAAVELSTRPPIPEDAMRTDRVAALFISMVLVVTPAIAQQAHVVDQTAIEEALSKHVADESRKREAVVRLLQREEVRGLAATTQLDLTRAEAAVQTLEGEELAQLASMAREAEAGLAGGSNITISSTMVIIGLLILILIIVAT